MTGRCHVQTTKRSGQKLMQFLEKRRVARRSPRKRAVVEPVSRFQRVKTKGESNAAPARVSDI